MRFQLLNMFHFEISFENLHFTVVAIYDSTSQHIENLFRQIDTKCSFFLCRLFKQNKKFLSWYAHVIASLLEVSSFRGDLFIFFFLFISFFVNGSTFYLNYRSEWNAQFCTLP